MQGTHDIFASSSTLLNGDRALIGTAVELAAVRPSENPNRWAGAGAHHFQKLQHFHDSAQILMPT